MQKVVSICCKGVGENEQDRQLSSLFFQSAEGIGARGSEVPRSQSNNLLRLISMYNTKSL